MKNKQQQNKHINVDSYKITIGQGCRIQKSNRSDIAVRKKDIHVYKDTTEDPISGVLHSLLVYTPSLIQTELG